MNENDVVSRQGQNGKLSGINEESEAQLKDEGKKKNRGKLSSLRTGT